MRQDLRYRNDDPAMRTAERALLAAAAAVAIGCGLRTASPLARIALALAAAAALYEAASSRAPLYRLLRARHDSAAATDGALEINHRIAIARSPRELYEFWRRLENLPRFMRHLDRVEQTDTRRSHWVARGPLGSDVQWDAEITRDVPGEEICWRSLPGSRIEIHGAVRFEAAGGNRGSIMTVETSITPPAGRPGAVIAKLLGSDPRRQVAEDLQRFKRLMESGA